MADAPRDFVAELLVDVVASAADACDNAGWPYHEIATPLRRHVADLRARLGEVEGERDRLRSAVVLAHRAVLDLEGKAQQCNCYVCQWPAVAIRAALTPPEAPTP